jgi:hypothetical protein
MQVDEAGHHEAPSGFNGPIHGLSVIASDKLHSIIFPNDHTVTDEDVGLTVKADYRTTLYLRAHGACLLSLAS